MHIIKENEEKYITFSQYIHGSSRLNFRFIDSICFMPQSLDALASYLKEYALLEKEFVKDTYTPEQIKLLKKKGACPYEYTNSLKSLKVSKLPKIEDFYSHLKDCSVTSKEYQHAEKV